MKAMNVLRAAMIVGLVCLVWIGGRADETVLLQNGKLGLMFDRTTGTLKAIENKLTGETYALQGDRFDVEAVEFHAGFAATKLVGLKIDGDTLTADYQNETSGATAGLPSSAVRTVGQANRGTLPTIQVQYILRGHFFEKKMTIASPRDYGLKKLVVSRPTFSAAAVRMIDYRHPKLGLNKGAEPTHTYFGRTAKGGFFTGVEMPWDASSIQGQQLVLGYAPNMKVKANEKIVCEPIYLGVYRKNGNEKDVDGLPLRSESDAMVAMTSALLPPQNRRIGPLICGWWSETFRDPSTPAGVQHDMRCIDFAVECGIDIVSDATTWAGQWQRVGALRGDGKFQLGELPLKLAEYARQKGVRWVVWPTMGVSGPWQGGSQPFRPDRPEWAMTPYKANCFGYRPAYDWLLKTIFDVMDAGHYGAWVMDGDFFGEPGFGGSPGYNGGAGVHGERAEPWVHPARCQSKVHDHLGPDINYVCQKNLTEMARSLRRRYPYLYMFYCRPAMDMGVWALRYVDACFTVNEWADLTGIPGMGPQPKNVLLGDKIRHWSRIRVHQHFFPHYLDSPLVFDAPKSMSGRDWTSEKIDYIMLSALSSSPNQTYYLPCTAGIPAANKREIKKWLDWGRANIQYIMVRKDLPDWPTPGKVDGSAHVAGDRGLIFLFNPGKTTLAGEFALTEESIGLKATGNFQVSQEYPASDRKITSASGRSVRWEAPRETAVVLRIQPAP